MTQDYMRMVDEYMRSMPTIDWERYEVFFVLDRKVKGQVEVGGHRLIDWDKDQQIKSLMEMCCCGQEGCTW